MEFLQRPELNVPPRRAGNLSKQKFRKLCLTGCAPLTVRPMVSARLGSILDPEDIKEGTNVFFECSITANPAAYSVSWLHNVSLTLFRALPDINLCH